MFRSVVLRFLDMLALGRDVELVESSFFVLDLVVVLWVA